MVLGLLAAGAIIGEEIARGIITRDKNNDLSWDPNAGGYSGAKSLESRVSQYITAGGRPEYQNATEHPKTFSIYNNPYSKQATGYNTFEYYKAPDGTYTRDLTKIANISMDENGKITVTVPDKWENDEQVASYVDSAMLKKLSGNYKMNKDVEYQDPYDESKKVKTQEYLDKINEALKFRVNVLDSLYPMKTAIISMFGGTEDKNKVANGIDTDDVIVMSLKYEDDDSWVPLPAYLLEAYPQLKELSTFNNGYVQKKDFLENFYNIEDAKITEANAYGISRTPGMMLAEIEDMTHDEVAKTVAFGNFIATVDPKRSNWQQFSQAVEGLSKGFYAGLYDWFIGESDLIANIANFSLITGNSVETRDFWNGLLGVDVSEETKKRMQVMAYTNKDAFSKAQAGYVQGRLAGQAIDTVVSMIAIGEATKAISTKITSAITEKGAENVAVKMAEGTDASTATGMATEAQAREAFLADVAKQNAAISKVATGGAKYQAFFAQTWDDALSLYYKVLGGTTAALQSMGPAQLANAVNAASKIATAASWANTAVNVLGSMTIAAVVGNKELTTKVLSGKATSDEAKSLILQTAWTVAKYGALFKVGNFIGGQAYKDFQGTKLEKAIKQFSQKASQKTTKFGSKITHPWLTFMKWYVNKKAVANKVSNAKLAKTEALKEAILADEMRAYGANLSTEPGSYGISAIEDALAASGAQRGATMAETLQNLERAGISFDPASLSMSSYEAWQADYVNAQNKITAWGDVEGNVSIVIHEFTNPDIEPVISQQMSEVNKANSDLLNAEKEAGLLSKKEISANKKLMKEDEGYLYAFHSPELARYIVRNYELRVITREALKDGVADLSSYTPYVEAKGRLEAAASAVPQNIREIADTRYVPALQKAEHEIIDRMIDPKWAVYPRAFVEAMRSSGKYGTNGDDWMRLVARKEVPTGAYNPFSKQAKQDNTIALGGFKVLDDADITWPGNGLTELITEFGIARTEKAFVEASKKATGLTTQVEVSGAKTAGAGKMKEFKTDFQKAIRKGFKAFTSEVEGTTAIGKKRALEQKEFFDEVAVTGGVSTIDIDSLRAVMREKGVILSESIVDQESLDKFLAESSLEARKLIIDVTGEKPLAQDVTNDVSVENPSLTEDVLSAIYTQQYDNLRALGDSNSTEYDTLMDKVDRANALASPEVRSSNEVSVAAEEYRSNIKEFEDTSIFTEKFSYLTKLSAPKGSLKEFAETNGLTLPDGKQSISAKVKHALWEKLQNGEELPRIKGIKKADISKDMDKKEFYKMLDNTELFKNPNGSNALKYDLDSEKIYTDIDDAIDTMLDMVKTDPAAKAAIEGLMQYQDYWYTAARYDFTVLSEILSKENADELERRIDAIAATVMKSAIPKNAVIIEGNRDQLFKKIKTAVQDKLESRFAQAKTQLESIGEKVESETITELLQKYSEEIHAAEDNDLVIKTTDKNGEIQYERVSPSIAAIYNERPIYTPISTPVQILADLALLKKINTTDINPRSFSKQAVSDPVMAFATVGAMPGTLQAMRSEIAAQFGPDILQALQKTDPIRYQNIQLIAQREGISEEQALSRNLKAISSTQVPFTLLNRELLHQANVAKYGNKAAIEMRRKNIAEKLNGALTKVSGKLGFLQDKRETYNRLLAGEKAYVNALRKGYNPTQAEHFREYAINTATTNFRLKHTMFNGLRITVPYLTSNISGAKSFWKMFELDPVGVSARIFTGFILPIMYFLGEIFSDENMRKKYEQLAESEKENHIVIAIGGELIPIPVGEEIGQYLNVVTHLVETLYGENQYSFWTLMLNDMVGLLPGADLTGFTDPEILEPLSRETPNFLEVMENGIAKVLASTAPPVLQSVYMYNTGRDLYTGKYIDNSYVTIDEDGNPQIMTYTTSQFAKFLANVVGGDARVIEKVTSGLAGATFLHLLDTLVSAGQFVATGGKEGSLTTAIDKALEDIAKPYSTYGYHALDKRLNAAINSLYRQKDEIVHGDPSHNLYMKYNQEISKESDPKKRQELKNKRDQLLTGFLNSVQKLVEGYRDAGGTLDKWKFSKIVSLITFEDAVRADRKYMELFTSYNDAYKQAMQTLYDMGIQNPEGPSSLGYIYTDKDGNPQLKMWTPTQIQIMQNAFYQQNDIYAAQIEGIIDDGSENSLKKQMNQLMDDEQQYWNKPKMTSADYDAIDEMRKAFNEKVVKALSDYMDTYGAANVLSNDAVIDYLNDIIRVPTAYEKIKGRNISSDNGKLNKQTGFAESYIKKIFKVEGVKK